MDVQAAGTKFRVRQAKRQGQSTKFRVLRAKLAVGKAMFPVRRAALRVLKVALRVLRMAFRAGESLDDAPGAALADSGAKLPLTQESDEAGLFKVAIVAQGFQDLLLAHDAERRAVRVAPVPVGFLPVEVEGGMKQVARLRNDLHVGFADGLMDQGDGVLAEK